MIMRVVNLNLAKLKDSKTHYGGNIYRSYFKNFTAINPCFIQKNKYISVSYIIKLLEQSVKNL